jgi:hypothetical protein
MQRRNFIQVAGAGVLVFAGCCGHSNLDVQSAKAPVTTTVYDQSPLHMGVGINIHLKGSDMPVKFWHGDKTEAEVRAELEKELRDHGKAVLRCAGNKTIEVDKEKVAFIEYREMSSVQWILDAGNL